MNRARAISSRSRLKRYLVLLMLPLMLLLSGCAKKVTIPAGTTAIADNAYYGKEDISEVSVPDTVTSIGNAAFYHCEGLKKINLPDSVTEIGDYAFSGCGALAEIVIPASVVRIGKGVFRGCVSLKKIVIPAGITSIEESTFEECTGLTEIILPDTLDAICEDAFAGCSGITAVTLPDSVTTIGQGAFRNCGSLAEARLPEGLEELEDTVFQNCKSLAEISLPDTVQSIGEATFEECTALQKIRIPASVQTIGHRALGDVPALDAMNEWTQAAVSKALANLAERGGIAEVKTAEISRYVGRQNTRNGRQIEEAQLDFMPGFDDKIREVRFLNPDLGEKLTARPEAELQGVVVANGLGVLHGGFMECEESGSLGKGSLAGLRGNPVFAQSLEECRTLIYYGGFPSRIEKDYYTGPADRVQVTTVVLVIDMETEQILHLASVWTNTPGDRVAPGNHIGSVNHTKAVEYIEELLKE